MKRFGGRINDNGEYEVNVSGMSRRSFCGLLASAGVAFVAAAGSGTYAYAEDGSEIAELSNVGMGADEINAELQAADDDSLLLGSFFVNRGDVDGSSVWHDVLCTSSDGRFFECVGVPYEEDDNPFHDPAIIYHDGYFWIIGTWQRYDQKFWPMFGYSKDLVEWSIPEGEQLINSGDWSGISYDKVPFGLSQVTNVAPDAFVDDDGTVYLVVCAGHYGNYYGEAPEADRMLPYLVKLSELSCDGLSRWTNDKGNHYPNNLRVTVDGPARQINLPISSDDRIDASLYKEGGTYYLCVKRDGINNEIYRNTVLGTDGWTLVKDGLSVGTEGPSLVKFKGQWRLYTDKIASWPPDATHGNGATGDGVTGIRFTTASDPAGTWADQREVIAVDLDRNRVHLRHGTVMVVDDPAALRVVNQYRSDAGWDDGPKAWFSDVSKSDWGHDAIYYCADNGLLSGYDGTDLFGPYDTLTRAQAAVVLWRYFCPDAAANYATVMGHTINVTGLSDVEPRMWYTGAANWVVQQGIMSGYSGTSRFGTNDSMNREQLFLVIANAATKLCGAQVAGSDHSILDSFPDGGDVSEWARDAVCWGLHNGVMGGALVNGVRYVKPYDSIDRSTLATVMRNAIVNGTLYR